MERARQRTSLRTGPLLWECNALPRVPMRQKHFFAPQVHPTANPARESRSEAKKFPVLLKSLAVRRGFVLNREFLSWCGVRDSPRPFGP